MCTYYLPAKSTQQFVALHLHYHSHHYYCLLTIIERFLKGKMLFSIYCTFILDYILAKEEVAFTTVEMTYKGIVQ